MPWNVIKGFEMHIDEENQTLVITLPLEDPPYPSKKTGRTMVIATTHGNLRTDLRVKNRNVRINLSAYYPIMNNTRCSVNVGGRKNRPPAPRLGPKYRNRKAQRPVSMETHEYNLECRRRRRRDRIARKKKADESDKTS